jgi:uncharacterized repeat protein (TIGR01451 family)
VWFLSQGSPALIASRSSAKAESGSGASRAQPRRLRRSAVLAVCLVAMLVSALPAAPAFGEGSVDLSTSTNLNSGRNTLRMHGAGAPVVAWTNRYSILRVYARAGETVQMGSSAMGLAGGSDDILVYPPGTSFASATDPNARAPLPSDPVFATDVFDCNVDDPGTGRIASRAEELAGPAPNPGGWAACEFTAPADGIYAIVMMPFNPSGTLGLSTGSIANPLVTTAQGAQISIWDVTVRDAGGVVQPGRLFTNRLYLHLRPAGVFPNSVTADTSAHVLTPAGYEYHVTMFRLAGLEWEVTANDGGVVDATTGAPISASFQWGNADPANTLVYTNAIAPQLTDPDQAEDSKFPLFFRPVDPVAINGQGGLAATRGYASAPISPSGALSGLAFAGAGGEQGATTRGAGGTIRFASPPQLEGRGYTVEIDLNNNGTFGDANDVVDATGHLSSASENTYAWSGKDAGGATPACGTTYPYRVRSTLAEPHFTLSDVENETGGIEIERLSLPGDPALGNPFGASYNDIDPYKGTAVTNTSPAAVNQGTSGPGFHAWSLSSGDTDFVDTWVELPEVSASGTLRVLCPGEVSVDKRASDGRVVVGDTVTYRLVAKNNSAGQADGVVVEDRVPSKLDVRSASSTQGDCDVSGNRVRCEIGTLAAGAEATVTVRAVAAEAGHSTNEGIVVAERCPAAGCDSDPAKVTIVKPKLGLTKTADDRRVQAGEIVTYVIRVTNPSKRAVRNVRTCDHLPAGLVAVKASPRVRVSDGRYCWRAKRIGAGKTKRYELTARTLPGAAGRTVNRATADSGAIRSTARVARGIRVLPRQAAGGGVTG